MRTSKPVWKYQLVLKCFLSSVGLGRQSWISPLALPWMARWFLHKDFVFQDSVVAAVSISPVLASAEQTKQIQQSMNPD